jgi:hypothetical protein
MISLRRISAFGILFGFCMLGSAVASSSPAQAEQSSSYQKSCSNIRIRRNLLSADCRTIVGAYNFSSIHVRGIENRNGNLTFLDSDIESSFQLSCTRIHISEATLRALCRKIDGTYKKTSIDIPGIANLDGTLIYEKNRLW